MALIEQECVGSVPEAKADIGARKHHGTTHREELRQLRRKAIVVEVVDPAWLHEEIGNTQQFNHRLFLDPAEFHDIFSQTIKTRVGLANMILSGAHEPGRVSPSIENQDCGV